MALVRGLATIACGLAGHFTTTASRRRLSDRRQGAALARTNLCVPLQRRDVVRELCRARKVNFTYLDSGLQAFILGSIVARAPSYMNR
jgi:hypothetical protein